MICWGSLKDHAMTLRARLQDRNRVRQTSTQNTWRTCVKQLLLFWWFSVRQNEAQSCWRVCTWERWWLSGPHAVESSTAVKTAVDYCGLIFVSCLFSRGLRHYSTTIARLSFPSCGLGWGGAWIHPRRWFASRGRAKRNRLLTQWFSPILLRLFENETRNRGQEIWWKRGKNGGERKEKNRQKPEEKGT